MVTSTGDNTKQAMMYLPSSHVSFHLCSSSNCCKMSTQSVASNLFTRYNSSTRQIMLGLNITRSLATSAQKRAAKRLAAQGKPVPPRPGLPGHNPINTKNIPKAPHMAKDAVKNKGILDHVKAAPFIPMVVLFPTLMMGIALIIRPDMRAQVFGTNDKKNKKVIPMNSDISSDQKDVLQEVQKVAIETVIDSTRDQAAVENPVEMTNQQEKSKEVRDLIYAIGIRPHQSS